MNEELSDIRAISSLQVQVDSIQERLAAAWQRLEDLEKIVEVLRYKGL